MIWPPWHDSSSIFPQIRKWGEGSIRSYYKPKQMKNLYDVETSVKKDVVSHNANFVAHTVRVSIWDTKTGCLVWRKHELITFQVIFRYEDPKKIIGRAWIGLACIPVCQNILKPVAHAFLSVWPVHESDLVDAEAYLGGMAGPRIRLKN